jgi:isoleucyl-tRNA synthetase
MRWFLMSSPVLRGGNLVVTEQGIRDGVRQVLLPLWNVWYFFSLYANTAGEKGYEAVRRTDSPDVLDRYLLAKTHDPSSASPTSWTPSTSRARARACASSSTS